MCLTILLTFVIENPTSLATQESHKNRSLLDDINELLENEPIEAPMSASVHSFVQDTPTEPDEQGMLILDHAFFMASREKQRVPITSAFDYISDLKMRIKTSFEEGNTKKAQNLVELVIEYLARGIPGVVGFDPDRTASKEELGIVSDCADLYVDVLDNTVTSLIRCDQDCNEVESITPSQSRAFLLIHRYYTCLSGTQLPHYNIGQKNAEFFISLALRKSGIPASALTQDFLDFHFAHYDNKPLERYFDQQACYDLIHYRCGFLHNPKGQHNPFPLEDVKGLLKSFAGDVSFEKKKSLPIKKASAPSQTRFVRNGDILIDTWYGHRFLFVPTVGDGSCFFHAAAKDNGRCITNYFIFKDKVKTEKDPGFRQLFRQLLRKEYQKSDHFNSQDFEPKNHEELAEIYWKNYKDSKSSLMGECWQLAAGIGCIAPSTLYCYLNQKCCFTYSHKSSSYVLTYIPSSFASAVPANIITMDQDNDHFTQLDFVIE